MDLCACGRIPPAGVPYSTCYCRLCWLQAYSPEFGGSSSGQVLAGEALPATARAGQACAHLG